MSAGYGVSSGHNFAASGIGLFEYYNQLLAAPDPFTLVSWAIVGFDVLTFGPAVLAVYAMLGSDMDLPGFSLPSPN